VICTSSYSLKKTMAQPTIGISQRLCYKCLVWATYVGLRIHGHSACISHLRSEAEKRSTIFFKNGPLYFLANALIGYMHSSQTFLYLTSISPHFADNNDMVTMLIAQHTEPHYHPLSKLTPDEAKLWFADRDDGLGIPAAALTAFQAKVSDPTDLIGLADSDVDAIQRSLATREYDELGKALPTFKLSNRVLLRLKGAIKLVNYLSMIRRDIHWDQLQWSNLRDFVYEWDALIATTKKTQGGEPPVWKRGQQTKVVSFLYSVADYLNIVYGQYHCPPWLPHRRRCCEG
jgi:hypothetical protein